MRFASDNNEDGSSKREQNENYLAYFIGETDFSKIFLRTIHWTDHKQVRCASGRSEIWCMQKSLRDFQWYITNISLEIPQYNIRLKFLAIFRPPLNRVQAVWIPDSGPKSYISLESSQALLHTPYLISSGCTSYLFTISYLPASMVSADKKTNLNVIQMSWNRLWYKACTLKSYYFFNNIVIISCFKRWVSR